MATNFLADIIKATGHSPTQIAEVIGVNRNELIRLAKLPAGELVQVDMDSMWFKLLDYVDQRTGLLLAVRKQLELKLARDNAKRIARRLSIEERPR